MKKTLSGSKLAVLALLWSTAMVHGCLWDSDLYDKYVGPKGVVTCSGVCDATGVDETRCRALASTSSGVTWVDEGYCQITSETTCRAEGGAWSSYQILDLGEGRYIRKASDNRFECGSYNAILGIEPLGKCTSKEIARFEDSLRAGICPATTPYCVNAFLRPDSDSVAMCSQCGTNQAMCGTSQECVDLKNNPEHCGACGNRCNSSQCVNGECVGCEGTDIECYCKNVDGTIECIGIDDIGDEKDDYVFWCVESCGKTCSDVGTEAPIDCDNSMVCLPAGASHICGCQNGTVLVNDECVSPNANATCGAHGEAAPGVSCDAKMLCVDGKCDCLSGKILCGDACVDPLVDPNHCGDCNGPCGANASCISGKCRCNPNYARCGIGNTCIATSDSKLFCGARGECNSATREDANYQGQACDIRCLNGECDDCPSPLLACDGRCINPNTDTKFCGATDCTGTNGRDCSQYGATCSSRVCVCPSGFELQTVSGITRCYDTRSDPNCCGPLCTPCGATQVCYASSCQTMACPSPTTLNCAGWCLDPDKNYVRRDPSNPTGRNCVCADWHCDTDGNPNNGCDGGKLVSDPELDVVSNTTKNCGECGKHCVAPLNRCEKYFESGTQKYRCTCPEGKTECSDGATIVCRDFSALNLADCEKCKDGWANDDGDWSNGCETDVSVSECWGAEGKKNCLSDVKNADGIRCKDGQCDYVVCKAGYGDCDGDRTNGCEAELNNTEFCGHCSIACKPGQDCRLPEEVAPRCCFDENMGCTGKANSPCGLRQDECCDGLKLWREQTLWFGNVCAAPRKDSYSCAKEKPTTPTGCWVEIK